MNRYLVPPALCGLLIASSALAGDFRLPEHRDDRFLDTFRAAPAPEIDPAGAFAAVTLLGGMIAVIRGRRPRK